MIHQRIELWNKESDPVKGNPGSKLNTYVLDGERTRPAVLICPGGGYHFLSPREAEPIALRYAAHGFHAFVVEYSVAPHRHPQPVLDVARALCIIREHAREWNVAQVALCGFSAGGHVAATLATHWERGDLFDRPGLSVRDSRPDALILSYPVISSGPHSHADSFVNLLGDDPSADLLQELSLETAVSASVPPAFLWHTANDESVPVENSFLFAQALKKAGVPFELHIFPNGPHGLSLATAETATEDRRAMPDVAVWHDLSVSWLRSLFGFE